MGSQKRVTKPWTTLVTFVTLFVIYLIGFAMKK